MSGWYVYWMGVVFTFIFSAIWARVLPVGGWAVNARIVFKKDDWKADDDAGFCVAVFIAAMLAWPVSLCLFALTFLLICWRKAAGIFDRDHLGKGNTSQGGFR